MKTLNRPFLICAIVLIAASLLSIAVGGVHIPLAELARSLTAGPDGSVFSVILFSLRLPRTALMLLVGAALAGSGAAYQGLFRNPLADPYLIGVASGAGLGAILAMTVRWPYTTANLLIVPFFAFLTALATVAVVYEMARIGKTVPTTNLILAGVAVSSFATALTSFFMVNATGELRRAVIWLLGGSSLSGWQPVLASLPYLIPGLALLLTSGHALNVLQFGDEQAQQLGLRVERIRLLVIAAASLTTAAAVSFSGIIGFVGLVVPHLLRMIWGGDYRRLIPLSMLGGATLLLVSDSLARVVMAPQELPVGIITALAGAPFFLWILRKTKQQNYW
jgi:iron complex transport system permease protein